VPQQHQAADGDYGQQGSHASGDGHDDDPFPLGHASPHWFQGNTDMRVLRGLDTKLPCQTAGHAEMIVKDS